MGLRDLMPPPGPNLRADIVAVEDGIARLELRAAVDGRLYETWHVFDAGPYGFRVHAERYDRNGNLTDEMDNLPDSGLALKFLVNAARAAYSPDGITTFPARLRKAVGR